MMGGCGTERDPAFIDFSKRVALERPGETPESFFGKIIYTYSHDNSIKAVALSLVDGAAVHGHIWEYFNRRDPEFTSKTRIIKKSVPFGNPPVVASSHLPESTKDQIRKILLGMHKDSEGKKFSLN
jgi:phosphonate transport system substrate-binding protein